VNRISGYDEITEINPNIIWIESIRRVYKNQNLILVISIFIIEATRPR